MTRHDEVYKSAISFGTYSILSNELITEHAEFDGRCFYIGQELYCEPTMALLILINN